MNGKIQVLSSTATIQDKHLHSFVNFDIKDLYQ